MPSYYIFKNVNLGQKALISIIHNRGMEQLYIYYLYKEFSMEPNQGSLSTKGIVRHKSFGLEDSSLDVKMYLEEFTNSI